MPSDEPKFRILIVNISRGFSLCQIERTDEYRFPGGIDANGSCSHYPQFGPSPDCPYPGWCLEIIDVLLRSGNISHEFIVDRSAKEDLDLGMPQDNGRFSGVFGRVESGNVDMVCMLLQKSLLRMAHFDYSFPISEVSPTFVVREIPVTIWSLILNCLRPYGATVWISILVSLIIQMVSWTLIGRAEINVKLRPQRNNGQYFAWEVFDEMFNAGDHPFYFFSGKLIRLVFSVFQRGLLPAMYTAFLLTALLTPADIAPIKSQTDAVHLIQTGRYKLISDQSHWFAQEIQLSSEKIFTELREATKDNPIIDTISDAHSLALVNEGGYIYQTATDETAFNEASGKCYTFIFSKGTRSMFHQFGEWVQLKNRRFPQPQCQPGMFAAPGATDPLNFWSVSGVFVIGSSRLIISAITFIIEIIVFQV